MSLRSFALSDSQRDNPLAIPDLYLSPMFVLSEGKGGEGRRRRKGGFRFLDFIFTVF